MGSKCWFVASDLSWPEYEVVPAILIGYNDERGLAILQPPTGTARAIHRMRVYVAEKDAVHHCNMLTKGAKHLYELPSQNEQGDTNYDWKEIARV